MALRLPRRTTFVKRITALASPAHYRLKHRMATALALMVLTAIALVIGAVFLWRRGGPRRQAIMMLVLAAIIAANVALWSVPTRSGKAPIDVGASAQGQ